MAVDANEIARGNQQRGPRGAAAKTGPISLIDNGLSRW
jgi:hypothetical protein